MLILIRSQTRDENVRHSLEALLGQVESGVWLGETTIRIFKTLEKLLTKDKSSDSFICKLGRTMQVSRFYSINSGRKKEVSFFEIYKRKSLLL